MVDVENAILQSFVELVEKIGPETAKKWSEVLEKVGLAPRADPRLVVGRHFAGRA